LSHTEINFHLFESPVTRSNGVSLNQQLIPALTYIKLYIHSHYLLCNSVTLNYLHIHTKLDNFMVVTFLFLKR